MDPSDTLLSNTAGGSTAPTAGNCNPTTPSLIARQTTLRVGLQTFEACPGGVPVVQLQLQDGLQTFEACPGGVPLVQLQLQESRAGQQREDEPQVQQGHGDLDVTAQLKAQLTQQLTPQQEGEKGNRSSSTTSEDEQQMRLYSGGSQAEGGNSSSGSSSKPIEDDQQIPLCSGGCQEGGADSSSSSSSKPFERGQQIPLCSGGSQGGGGDSSSITMVEDCRPLYNGSSQGGSCSTAVHTTVDNHGGYSSEDACIVFTTTEVGLSGTDQPQPTVAGVLAEHTSSCAENGTREEPTCSSAQNVGRTSLVCTAVNSTVLSSTALSSTALDSTADNNTAEVHQDQSHHTLSSTYAGKEEDGCSTPRATGHPTCGACTSEPAALPPLYTSPSPSLTPPSPTHSTCSTTPLPAVTQMPGRNADSVTESDISPATSPTKSCMSSTSHPPAPSIPPPGTSSRPESDHAAGTSTSGADDLQAAGNACVGTSAAVTTTRGLHHSTGSGGSGGLQRPAAGVTWLGRYWRSSSMSESSTGERHCQDRSTDDHAVGGRCTLDAQHPAESVNAESGHSSCAATGNGTASSTDGLHLRDAGHDARATHTDTASSIGDTSHVGSDNADSSRSHADCARTVQPPPGPPSLTASVIPEPVIPVASTWWRASRYAYSLMGSMASSLGSTLNSTSRNNSTANHAHHDTSQNTNIPVQSHPQLNSTGSPIPWPSTATACVFASLPVLRSSTPDPADLLDPPSPSPSCSLIRPYSDAAASSSSNLNATLNRLPPCIQQAGDTPASLLSLDTGALTYIITQHLKPNRRACAALRATCQQLRQVVNGTTTVLQVNGRSMEIDAPTCLALWQNKTPRNCLSHDGFTNVDTLVLKVAERDSGSRWDSPSWHPDTPWPALTPCLQHSVRTVVVHVYGVRIEGRRCEPDVLRVLALLHRLPSLTTLMWVQRGRWSLSDLPLLQQLPTSLTTLYFYHRKMGSMDCMRILITGLSHLTNLRQLHIHHLPVSLLPCLSPLSRLQKVTGVMANSAMALLQLEHMSLGDVVNSVTLNKSKLWLSPAPHLTSLVLNKCQVQPTALKNAAWLKSLKMYSCTCVTRFADLVPLFELRCLTQLHVLSSHATTSTNRGQWWLNRALLDALQQLQPDMLAARTLQDLSLVLQVEEAHQFGALPKLGLLGRLQSLSLFFLQGWPTVPCAGPHAAAMLQLLMGHANIKQLKAFHISLYEPSQVLALQTPLTHPSFTHLLTCHLTFHITTLDVPAVLSVLRALSSVKLHVDLKLEEGSYGSMSDMLHVLCGALCQLRSLAEVRLCTPMLNVCPINDADSLLMLRSLSKLQRLEIDTSFGIGSGARVHGDVLDAVQELERVGVSAELLSGYMCLPQRVPPLCTLPQRAWVRQLAALLILGWWFLQ